MLRVFKLLPQAAVLLAGAVLLATPPPAQASFQLRATSYDASGNLVSSQIQNSGGGPGSAQVASFSLSDFSVTIVTNISNTGPGFSSHSSTVNLTYNGPAGATSHTLLVEVLGDSYTNPTAGTLSVISSNGSPSTSGLLANNVQMTSGVINGNVALGANATLATTPLGSQLGMTTGVGTMGSASSVLVPNPASGSPFAIANPFTFYQTYTFGLFQTSGQSGSLTAGSTVVATPAPAGLVLALSGLPVLGGAGWLRRRTARLTSSL